MSNDSITIDNDNDNIDKYVILRPLTPQNFLFQMNKSLLNSSANQSETKKSQTLVDDNYSTIYVVRVKGQRKFYHIYKILSLGLYPLVVQKTQCNSMNSTIYQIPDSYSVSLTIFKIQIKCNTQYQSNSLKLGKCSSNLSGVALFRFDLDCLEKKYDQLKNSNNSLLMNQRKPLKELSPSQINRRIKSLAIDIKNNIQSLFLKHNATSLNIEKVNIRHNDDIIELNFQPLVKNSISNKYLDSIVYACDDSLISRDNLR
ncbi:hypothetical protein F8M41_012378 [Gigaspora margarita]|uniref:Uncharacterized protein n=1 Tax=Gigaspora margarita TaxID=4874 RepID=A0A8H4AT92_GIGMA|nr:hypothetical protein F8M41_012378 [Gigaspora margarita]